MEGMALNKGNKKGRSRIAWWLFVVSVVMFAVWIPAEKGVQAAAITTVNANPVSEETSPVADLTIVKAHSGSFTQGQRDARYMLMIHNIGPGSTVGEVTVTESLPAGLTLIRLQGNGWTCETETATCK